MDLIFVSIFLQNLNMGGADDGLDDEDDDDLLADAADKDGG